MLDKSSKDTLLSKAKNNDIWHANDFCDYLALNTLSLSFTIYNTLNNRGKWQNLKQEKISAGRKRIFKKLSLLFFGVNVNVYKQISLQALWKMLQPLKHWWKIGLSSINIKGLFIWKWAGLVRQAGSPRSDDFYPTFMWDLHLSSIKKFVMSLEKDHFDQVVFTITNGEKPSCRTNVLILFN